MKSLAIFANTLMIFLLLTSASLTAQVKKESSHTFCKTMKHNHQMMHEMTSDSSSQHKMHDMKIMKDSTHQMTNEEHKITNEKKSSLIREGEIDLNFIDENKDGKVFQDQMDWNVISDKPGKCPLCGMKLKEVTIEKAKANLLKNGFKVK